MHLLARSTAAAITLLAMVAATPGWAAQTVSVRLQWTAPGDDGHVGRALRYVLRYSTALITSANFDRVTRVARVRRPGPPGSIESITVRGLVPDTRYFFALKTLDDAGNWSALSNVESSLATTTGVDEAPETLSFSAPWPNPARTSLRFAFALPRPALVQVDAFSVNGRHVRRLASGGRPAGHGEFCLGSSR